MFQLHYGWMQKLSRPRPAVWGGFVFYFSPFVEGVGVGGGGIGKEVGSEDWNIGGARCDISSIRWTGASFRFRFPAYTGQAHMRFCGESQTSALVNTSHTIYRFCRESQASAFVNPCRAIYKFGRFCTESQSFAFMNCSWASLICRSSKYKMYICWFAI